MLAVGITALSIVAGKFGATMGMMPSDEEIVSLFTEQFESEEFVISYVADQVVGDFEQQGRPVSWPAGVDPGMAQNQGDYPEDVWAEAEGRWAGWTDEERMAFREARESEVRTNIEESLPEVRAAFSAGGFAGSFSPMDFIFFGLGMVTAWGIGSGKKSKHQIETDFFEAVRSAMLRVMIVDGSIEDAEIEAAVNIYTEMTGLVVTPEQMRADAALAQSGGVELEAALATVGPHLNVNGRGMVVKAALLVALADGDFAPQEQQLVHGISRVIGLTDDEFRQVLADVMQAHDEAIAEEGGLLGSGAFVANPPVPLSQVVANINVDSPQPFGVTRDVAAIGLVMNTLGETLAEVAEENGLRATGDPNPAAGSFYRSDQVSFAKAGIPALYLQAGTDYVEPLTFDPRAFRAQHYHQPSDEVHPEWDLRGAARDMTLLLEVALRAANADEAPRWVPGHEFEEEWKELYGRN